MVAVRYIMSRPRLPTWACSASSPRSAAWACAASRPASSWARSRRRGSRCPGARRRRAPGSRCLCVSAPISCTVRSGAPDSSNWPPGSSDTVPPSALAVGALQGDDVVALHDRLPAEAGDQPLHQRAHAARALIGHGPQRVGVEQELLVLGADAPALAGFEPAAIQAMRSSRERTVGAGALSWRVDIGLTVLVGGGASAASARRRPLLIEKPRRAQAVTRPRRLTPVAEHRVHEGESGDGGGVGAQNARSQ